MGIQLHYLDSCVLLNQSKYINDWLHKLEISLLRRHLSLKDRSSIAQPFVYRSTIEALQYHTQTRPYIAYIINQLSEFVHAPTDVHWQAIKCVLRYLSGTKHFSIYSNPIQTPLLLLTRILIEPRIRMISPHLVFTESKYHVVVGSTHNLNIVWLLMPLWKSIGSKDYLVNCP